MNVQRQLGELLVDKRIMSRDDLEEQIHHADEASLPLAHVVVERGVVRSRDVLRTVAEELGIRYIALEGYERIVPDQGVVHTLTRDIAASALRSRSSSV